MSHNITIKDIARKFKCSPSTVSRALNNHENINIETRKTICEYAERMGYQKNAISLSLLNKATKTIGVLVPTISYVHEQSIIEGIQSVSSLNGYMLNICITNENLIEEKRQIEKLLANRIDAILISASHESFTLKDFDHFNKVLKSSIPLIFIDRKPPIENCTAVTTDDFEGAFIATQHLIDLGRKNLAFLAGSSTLEVCKNRRNGFLACMKKNNVKFRPEWLIETKFDSESAVLPTYELYKNKNVFPDGLFCVNDNVAFGATKVLRALNYSIPAQVAVVGFDNSPLSSFFYPSITSIDRRSFEVGKLAAEIILKSIQKEETKNQKLVLSPTLKIKESSNF